MYSTALADRWAVREAVGGVCVLCVCVCVLCVCVCVRMYVMTYLLYAIYSPQSNERHCGASLSKAQSVHNIIKFGRLVPIISGEGYSSVFQRRISSRDLFIVYKIL